MENIYEGSISMGLGGDQYDDASDWRKIEKCVLCGNLTPYLNTTHVDERNYYVEGAGQLCEQCYKNLYEINISEELKEI